MTNGKIDFDRELRSELVKYGTMFSGGKQRVYDLVSTGLSDSELAAKLKREYGIGGHSYTYADGTNGFVDHDGKGMHFRTYADYSTALFSWQHVASVIRELINDRLYLKPDLDIDPEPAVPEADDFVQYSIFDIMA